MKRWGLFIGFVLAAGTVLAGTAERGESFTFVQVCDPQLGYKDYEREAASFRRAVRQINRLGPDFVVICGDLVQDAGAGSFADFTAIKEGFEMPCYYVPGNHDVGNKPTAESLDFYRQTLGADYFSIAHKGTVFVFVNMSLWKEHVPEETEKQDAWLSQTLAEASAAGAQIFVVGHYPLFTKHAGEWENYFNLPKKTRRRLLELFERYQVAAVLTGHRHRLVVNRYGRIQMVSGETTSRNSDKRPLGFRVWTVNAARPPEHVFVPLEE